MLNKNFRFADQIPNLINSLCFLLNRFCLKLPPIRRRFKISTPDATVAYETIVRERRLNSACYRHYWAFDQSDRRKLIIYKT